MALKEYRFTDPQYGERTVQWDTDERPLGPGLVEVDTQKASPKPANKAAKKPANKAGVAGDSTEG